jgi:hypothetical protein
LPLPVWGLAQALLRATIMGHSNGAQANPGPGNENEYVWNIGICHTWYRVDYGKGNVPNNIPPPPESNIWDGDNPPPSDRCYPWCL